MEATFVVDPQEVDAQLLTRMLEFFKDKREPITLRLIESPKESFNWQKWFEGMENIRKRTEAILMEVPPGLDINDIIDGINHVDL
jgi:hypothetical protein